MPVATYIADCIRHRGAGLLVQTLEYLDLLSDVREKVAALLRMAFLSNSGLFPVSCQLILCVLCSVQVFQTSHWEEVLLMN